MSLEEGHLEPDIIYMVGDTVVPAKNIKFKKNKDGTVTDKTRPQAINFQNALHEDLKKALAGETIFPTKEEVFVSLRHGFHSKREYQKCDLDNRAKTILDALTGVVYEDDSQVKILLTEKDFFSKEQTSFYSVRVKILDDESRKKIGPMLALLKGPPIKIAEKED